MSRNFVAIIGSRSCPSVGAGVVSSFVSRAVGSTLAAGSSVASGGALGIDTAALSAVVAAGPSACSRSCVVSAFTSVAGLPSAARAVARRFLAAGGSFITGLAHSGSHRFAVVAALRRRSIALCSSASAVLCFFGSSSSAGSLLSCRAAVAAGVPVVAWSLGSFALPSLGSGRWVALSSRPSLPPCVGFSLPSGGFLWVASSLFAV